MTEPNTAAVPVMPNTSIACMGCFLDALTATSSMNASSYPAGPGASKTAPPDPAGTVVFTAYTITSVWDTPGTCATTSYRKILTSPFTAVKPITYTKTDYAQVAQTSFKSWLGLATCQELTVDSYPESDISRLSSAVDDCVVVPIAFLAFLLLGVYAWPKRKTKARAEAPDADSDHGQPYLQQKAELEDEERRRYELEAQERKYELDGKDTIHDLPTISNPDDASTVSGQRQELRGHEHTQEMGGL